MSSSNSLRRFLAQPLVIFDSVRVNMQKNPRSGNFMMMLGSMATILMMGNGADKLTTARGVTSSYEHYRRTSRMYVPYLFADYSYRFPQIRQ